MEEKIPKLNFSEGMKIWQEQRLLETAQQGDHISTEMLEKMAIPAGLAAVDETQVEHLASCPWCLGKWQAVCRELTGDRVMMAADDWYTGGLLEAAASGVRSLEPRSLPSQCGRFQLRIFPEGEGSGGGMVALEVTDVVSKDEVEGSQVTLRDSKGNELLCGKIIAGRLARMVDNISEFDLHSWSLRVQRSDVPDHEK